jgi:transcription-repair coupling factor (superfamily II helicase)
MFGVGGPLDTSALVAQARLHAFGGRRIPADIADLKPGDYIVHTQHGVGNSSTFAPSHMAIRPATSWSSNLFDTSAKLYVPLTRYGPGAEVRDLSGEASPPP